MTETVTRSAELHLMNLCYTSYRPFPDGPVKQPFLESDPANMAYVLDGFYLSFYTLKKLSQSDLEDILRPYDLVIVALDVEAIELVCRIVKACPGRVATYSEGHVGDYQQLSPAGQVSFLEAIQSSQVNFLYWERYVPFYEALANTPAVYLPYPYLLAKARRHYRPLEERPVRLTSPTGLAGFTRNGLAGLTVARRLLAEGLIAELDCWLGADTFQEDVETIDHFIFSTPYAKSNLRPRFNWRRWLHFSRIDYRPLLKLKQRVQRPLPAETRTVSRQVKNISFRQRGGWDPYMARLASSRVLLELNNRETVGRNALDCAALGLVSVSTPRSDMQPRLFPETTLADSWDVNAAYQLCRHLLEDVEFHGRVTTYAAEKVKEFDVTSFRRRFQVILARYPHLCSQEN
jgi:hypothetical protein